MDGWMGEEGRKTGEPRKNPQRRERTNNKLNSHTTPSLYIKTIITSAVQYMYNVP
jgi:hypothetical protein